MTFEVSSFVPDSDIRNIIEQMPNFSHSYMLGRLANSTGNNSVSQQEPPS